MADAFKGRTEDHRFITGTGRYVADIVLGGMAHAFVLRSPHAHARIVSIDVGTPSTLTGVIAVYTAADLAADGIGRLEGAVSVRLEGGGMPPLTSRPVLAADTVRYVGEAVALVIAESREIAALAAEEILVEYEPLIAVPTVREALEAHHEDADQPIEAFCWRKGDAGSVRDALATSHHVTAGKLRISRVLAAPLEPRGAVASIDDRGRLLVSASHQNPYQLRQELASALGVDIGKLRVTVPDVGGSFGMKSGAYPEYVLTAWAARHLSRPVRWIAERSESFLSDCHGRDIDVEAQLGLDKDGNFTALHVQYAMNVGAYLSERGLPAITNIAGVAGVYRTPVISAEIRGFFTNSVPMAPYRGAGRPEATYTIERLIDIAAAEIGMAPFELRRRNLVPAEAMPWQTGFTFKYDSGDFPGNMQMAAELSAFAEFETRRQSASDRGKLRGIGISNPIEVAGGPFGNSRPDTAKISVRGDGKIALLSGMLSTGQGLETALPSVVAKELGMSPDQIVYMQGDTDDMEVGHGQGGSSGLSVGGVAVVEAATRFIESGKVIAAEELEVSTADLIFSDSHYQVPGTDISITLPEVMALAEQRTRSGDASRLYGEYEYKPSQVNFPNGCHICEVEIDPETGEVSVIDYWAVEDLGRVINPVLVEGQLHGGVAQGLGQALGETLLYDEGGQLLTASFMDYQMPRATDMPTIHGRIREIPTQTNTLGVKGVGEAGTVGSLAAVMNAICSALAPLGVKHLDMPATPARIFEAIRTAPSKRI